MPGMLSLASRLRRLDGEALRTLIARRSPLRGDPKDFFDLAEALLDRAGISAALARRNRAEIAVLVGVQQLSTPESSPGRAELLALLRLHGGADSWSSSELDVAIESGSADMLLEAGDDAVGIYPAVAEQVVAALAAGLPALAQLAVIATPVPERASPADQPETVDRLAAERAFRAVRATAEILVELARTPARALAKGGIALPDAKRLGAATGVDPDRLRPLLALAAAAHLVERQGDSWLMTSAGETWQQRDPPGRWSSLAAAWRAGVPANLIPLLETRLSAGWDESLLQDVRYSFPAGGAILSSRMGDTVASAEMIGIHACGVASSFGVSAVTGDLAAATKRLVELLPDEVQQVYLQHDLTVVSPGPLAAPLDARLRKMADVESAELATSYRISPASLSRAMAGGESATSIAEFLRSISLSGLPQPVSYAIQEAERRYGRLRVGSNSDGGGYLRSADGSLLSTVAVDRALGSLGLRPDGQHRLRSRQSVDTLFWALTDARYPVALEDERGEIVDIHRRVRSSLDSAPVRPAASAADELAARLIATDTNSSADQAQQWLARQLTTAVRERATVTVSISMPGGEIAEYVVQPSSMGKDRLRARDKRADIERTFPLRSILSVTAN